MATAAEILVSKGGSLGKALDWMVDEGYDWSRMRRVIAAAKQADRNVIKGPAWMKYWVGQLGNDEMADLVKMLPLDLPTKLRWMKAEGSNWSLMKGVILSVPLEARLTVVQQNDLRAFFVDECGDEEMYDAVKLLGGPLRKQLAWMADEGCEDGWIKERVNAVKDDVQRRGVYYEDLAAKRIRKMSHRDRATMAKELGGTPDEQMSLFQNDVPINLLTWATTPSADWVNAFLKYRKNPLDLLQIASPAPATWGPLITPRLWDLLKDHHDVLYPEYRVKVFWEAYGNGSTFNAAQIMHFIEVLSGRTPVPGGKEIKGEYKTVNPTDDTARAFLELVKPGGSSGAGGISREELGQGIVAFASKRWDAGNKTWIPIGTSYFYSPYIVIGVTDAGVRDTSLIGTDVAGTPFAVGTGMTMFANHARHEIGHAVGERRIGKMKEKGNDFAEEYGGWKKSSKSAFERALWTDVAKPAAGWPSVPIAGTPVTLTNKDVHDWCMGVLKPGAKSEVSSNPITTAPGTMQQKLAAIKGSLWGAVKLVKYLVATNDLVSRFSAGPGGVTVSDMRDNAYMFPNYDPPDPVPIVSTRWGDDYVTYKKDAYRELKPISWYALSSPGEMFAELYTARYAQKTLPGRVGTRDPAVFFATLESQRDPMFGK